MTNITLEQAGQVLDAALTAATETGVPSTIAVLDTGAHIVALSRQDGAPLISVDSSIAKARTSVAFGGAETADLAGAVQPGAPLFTLGGATADQLTFVGGGIPLHDGDGALIGAVGSGGGTPDQDIVIARAGSASLR